MKLKLILVIGLLCIGTFALAQTDQQEEPKLGITLDATWASEYIWRGFDLYDDSAAFQPSLDLDLFGTGFSVNIWQSTACTKGYGEAEEFDYAVTYQNSLFNDSKYKTEYSVSYVYYDYFRINDDKADAQEFNMSLSWPDICSFGVTPTYTVAYMYPSEPSSTAARLGLNGFAHILGLSYDYVIPDMEQPITLSWDITYNDGQGGTSVEHDWSHMTWGLATGFDYGPGSFAPAVYFQTSMEDSVNTEDEFWATLSYSISF